MEVQKYLKKTQNIAKIHTSTYLKSFIQNRLDMKTYDSVKVEWEWKNIKDSQNNLHIPFFWLSYYC